MSQNKIKFEIKSLLNWVKIKNIISDSYNEQSNKTPASKKYLAINKGDDLYNRTTKHCWKKRKKT